MRKKLLSKLMLLVTMLLVGAGSAWADSWVKTSASDLQTGDIVAIVDETSSRAMSNDNGTSKAPTATEVTISSEEISEIAENLQWVVTVSGAGFQFNVPETENYLYCTNTNNGVRVGTNENNVFTYGDVEGQSVPFMVNVGTSRYIGVYNNQDWRCYTTVNNNIKDCVVAFYKYTAGVGDTRTATTVTIDETGITNTELQNGTTAGKLNATVKDNSGAPIDGATVTWTSSDEDVATVAADGKVTLVGAGTTTITAAYAGDESNYKGSSATYKLTVTNNDPNVPGTKDNPYTVADAVDAIVNDGTVTGVYVTGIISQIDSYNSTYKSITYWISEDGSTDNQFQVYSGKGVDGADFSSKEDLQLGDEVVVFGNIKKYNSVYEFDKNNQIVSLKRSEKRQADLSYEETSFSVNIGDDFTAPVLVNPNRLDVTFSSDNDMVATVDATGAVTIVGVGTATITASFAGNDNFLHGSASYTLTVVDPNGPGMTAATAYTVAQAREAIDNGGVVKNVYAKGIVSEIVTAYNAEYGNITYNISTDGSTEADQLQAFRGKSYEGENFTSADDIQVGDEVVIFGNLKKYNTTYEFDANNQLVELNRPEVPEEPVIVAEDVTIEYDATSGEITFTIDNADGAEELDGATTDAEWISDIVYEAGKVTFTVTANETDADRQATVLLTYGDTEKEVTVTQKHFEVDYATLPFEWDSKEFPAGVTNSGVNTYDKTPYLKFDSTGDYVVLKINETPGALTFDLKGNGSPWTGTFTLQVSADGENYTDLATYTELTQTVQSEMFNLYPNVRYIKWIYTEKVLGNVALGNIQLVSETKTYTAVVGEAGWNSMIAPADVAFPSVVKAYIVSAVNATSATLKQVNAVAKGTPILVNAEPGSYELKTVETTDNVSANQLKASNGNVKADGTIYALAVRGGKAGFYLVKPESKIPAGKAYLQVAGAPIPDAREFLDFVEEQTDGIAAVEDARQNVVVYNLAGQRVAPTRSGIYVKGGRKYIVK